MPGLRHSRSCLALLVASTLAASLPEAARAASPYDPILERVLKLLPKRPFQVVVIDPSQAQPDVRRTLLTLDAFITKGGRVVYLTNHSEVLQGALKGSQLCELHPGHHRVARDGPHRRGGRSRGTATRGAVVDGVPDGRTGRSDSRASLSQGPEKPARRRRAQASPVALGRHRRGVRNQ